MAQAESITFKEFQNRFTSEASCRDFLFQNRFPNGFVCPKCGYKEYYPIRSRGLYQCKECRKQTSVTAGTVMHRSHISLVNWFWAIYLCANDKRGISAVHLSKMLGIGYESAWYMLKRIRLAMGQRDANYLLSGLLEMDEGYFGAKHSGGKRGRGTNQKKVVVALSKTVGKENPVYIRLQQVPDVKRATLQEFVDTFIKNGSTIDSDGFRPYMGLKNVTVNTKVYNAADGDLRWIHTAIGNVKAFLIGTYHGRCKNLQPYLDEFCFRFNRRFSISQLFSRLARAVAVSSQAESNR